MRKLFVILFVTLVVSIPNYSFAGRHEKSTIADKTISTIKANPATSAGAVACGVAIAFFPPAAIVCGGALVAGASVDQVNK